MKIAHVLTRIADGGTERNLADSLESEGAAGHECTVFHGASAPQPLKRLRRLAATVEVSSLTRDVALAGDLRAYRDLRRELTRFDMVHTHHSKAGAIGRLSLMTDRRIVVAHTVHMASFGLGYTGRNSVIFRSVERMCARRTDFLCFVGSELRDSYTNVGIRPRQQTEVLRSAIDVEGLLEVRRGRTQRSGRSPAPLVIAIGALEPRKRHSLMLDRLSVPLRENEFILKIAGAGPERGRIESEVHRLGLGGSVELLGHVPDVKNILARADALVHTSSAEGVPQAVMQALVVGVPVVATEVEGLREIPGPGVAESRRDGSDLALVIRRVLNSPAAPLDAQFFDEWRPDAVRASYLRFIDAAERMASERSKLVPEVSA